MKLKIFLCWDILEKNEHQDNLFLFLFSSSKEFFFKGTFVSEDKLLSDPNSSLKVLLVMLNKEVQKNAFFQEL